MPFNIPEQKERKTYTKTTFLRLDPGTHLVRFLESPDNALMVQTHFVLGKFTLQCIGDDCPICASNKKMIFDHPDDFREQRGYSPKVTNYLINVMDRTVAKVCPQCGEEVKVMPGKNVYSPTCPGCGTFVTEVKPLPLNKVKLLKFGVQLATQLNTIEKSTCDPEGNPLGLMTFDMALAVEGSQKKKITTPIPVTNNKDVFTIPAEMLQDKANAMIRLERGEIMDFLRGTSLKDIFTARRAGANAKYSDDFMSDEPTHAPAPTAKAVAKESDEVPWEDATSLQDDINNLLK